MVMRKGRTENNNDAAAVGTTTLNNSTAVTISAANVDRIFFHVDNDSGSHAFWLRLYPAATDNIKQGIFVASRTGAPTFWRMPVDNIYTGEISAIAVTDSPTAYTTEY